MSGRGGDKTARGNRHFAPLHSLVLGIELGELELSFLTPPLSKLTLSIRLVAPRSLGHLLEAT